MYISLYIYTLSMQRHISYCSSGYCPTDTILHSRNQQCDRINTGQKTIWEYILELSIHIVHCPAPNRPPS